MPAEEPAKNKPKKDLINKDSDEPDHDDGQDVNDNTKMQQPQFSKELDLAAEDIGK